MNKNNTFKRLIKKSTLNNKNNMVLNFFKLIKSSIDDVQLVKSVYRLVEMNSHTSIKNDLNDIIEDNPDCLFNGPVYRKIDVNSETILIEMGEDVSINNFINTIKKHIKVGKHQSATKSLEVTKNFMPDSGDECTMSVTIKFEANNGIDIQALANKYYELNKDSDNESMLIKLKSILSYANEQEVYTLLTNDFEIVQVNDVPIEEFPDPLTNDVIDQINPKNDKEEQIVEYYENDNYYDNNDDYDDSIPF